MGALAIRTVAEAGNLGSGAAQRLTRSATWVEAMRGV